MIQEPDCLNCLDAIAAGFVLTGCNWKRERVYGDIDQAHAPVLVEVSYESRCYCELRGRGSSLTLLVDGEGNDGRPVLAHQRHNSGEARVGAVAVFVVDRIDHCSTANALESGFDHGWFGRIEHKRKSSCGCQAAD